VLVVYSTLKAHSRAHETVTFLGARPGCRNVTGASCHVYFRSLLICRNISFCIAELTSSVSLISPFIIVNVFTRLLVSKNSVGLDIRWLVLGLCELTILDVVSRFFPTFE